jgi:glycosyltransferase involved in cell wall biosynthesis
MRVLHVCPFFLPSEGGSERAVYYITKELTKLGVPCDVATVNTLACCVPENDNDYDMIKLPHRVLAYRSAKLPESELIDGVHVYRFPYLGLGYSPKERARILSPRMLVFFYGSFSNYDLVHFHVIGFLETTYAMSIICRKHNIPYIMHVHGIFEFYESYQRYSPLIQKFMSQVLRSSLGNAARIFAISKADLDILSNFGVLPSKVTVVPCGVDPKALAINNGSRPERHNAEKFRVLFVGTLYPNKGVEFLIKALSLMPVASLQRLTVDIVGDTSRFPSYFEELKRMVAEYKLATVVQFQGHIEQNLLAEKYRSADVLVRPSTSESFGIAAIEAMAVGTPAIVTDVGGASTFIKTGKTGILVPAGDAESLKDALQKLMYDDSLRVTLGKNGKEYVLNKLTWPLIAKNIENSYKAIA